jgi:uncharacterized SAM-binding protein YcdF (DUF218 family)
MTFLGKLHLLFNKNYLPIIYKKMKTFIKKKWKHIVVTLIFWGLIFAFRHTILVQYARFFEQNNATKGADMLLILSGNVDSRSQKAIELYRQGYAPVLAGTDEREDIDTGLRRFMQSDEMILDTVLKYYKIPHFTIKSLQPKGASSTFDEAYDLAAYVKKNPATTRHIIIVTDGFHSRRAYFAFKKIFKLQNITPQMCRLEIAAAYTSGYTAHDWWRSEKGMLCYLTEPIKFAAYLFRSKNLKTIDDKK